MILITFIMIIASLIVKLLVLSYDNKKLNERLKNRTTSQQVSAEDKEIQQIMRYIKCDYETAKKIYYNNK